VCGLKADGNAAEYITSKVLNSRAFKHTKSLSIFLSMPGREVSTDAIVKTALADGKTVFVPYIHRTADGKGKEMAMLELHNSESPETLQRDSWGIPTLARETIATRRNALGGFGITQSAMSDGEVPPLDLIFMPAVAFDGDCRRLGHGKGFYDRYLDQYERAVEARRPRVETPLLSMIWTHIVEFSC
jgi:5-formyltetrahydrofolate cyclo-ligase